ncbi:hypothetical protein [Pontibacillus sp. HMF3514]|uniref:hypothetical protein n=1 Tax=Pontibacillus sp. HMF3514 TaxID=2692425 RepID=UPI0013201DC9|nr:hypothetical protein [Pontibacillus sp. HMF3514]QHE53637.1 hypothetical protein GS400_17155 [Pontibacillus sp. HMF3514]
MSANKEKEKRELPDWLLQKSQIDNDPFYYKNYAEQTMNTVPFQDVLLLNENHIRRRKLLQLLKQDSFKDIQMLKVALENEDTETSHYAASSILESKRKLLNDMQEIEVQLNKSEDEDLELLLMYSERMKEYIDLEFVDENTKRKYMYQYTSILARVLEEEESQPKHFINKIEYDLQLKEYQQALQYSQKFLNAFPYNEDAYFAAMKVYYALEDEERFRKVLTQLKQSTITLSPKGLNRIRYWNRRQHDGTEV